MTELQKITLRHTEQTSLVSVFDWTDYLTWFEVSQGSKTLICNTFLSALREYDRLTEIEEKKGGAQ